MYILWYDFQWDIISNEHDILKYHISNGKYYVMLIFFLNIEYILF